MKRYRYLGSVRSRVQLPVRSLLSGYYLDGWLRTQTIYNQLTKINSAFHPSGVGKSSTSLSGWG